MEKPRKTTFTVNMEPEEWQRVRYQAFVEDCPISAIFRKAIRAYLAEKEGEGQKNEERTKAIETS